MSKILEVLGELIDALIGPSTTCTYLGAFPHHSETLRSTVNGHQIDVGVTSRRIVYRTHYKRWWMPDHTEVVYEVVGHVPEESKHLVDPRVLQPITYPLLCNPMLKWTRYPHFYAINAYLDRVRPQHRPYQVVP